MSTGNDGWLPPGSGSSPAGQPQWTAPGSPTPGQAPTGSAPPGAQPVTPPPGGPAPGVPAAWQQPAQGPDAAAPTVQPGVVPPRPMRIGDIYSAATSLLRVNAAATFGLTGLTAVLVVVPVTLLITGLTGLVSSASLGSGEFAEVFSGSDAEFFISQFAGLLSSSLSSPIIQFAATTFIAFVVGQAVFGAKVGMEATWRGARGRIWPVALAGLFGTVVALIAIAIVVGVVALAALYVGTGPAIFLGVMFTIAAIPVSVIVWTRFAFLVQAIVLEGTGPVAAYRRSWALTRGPVFWRTFGIRFLTASIVTVVASVVTAPIGAITGGLIGSGLVPPPVYILMTGLTTVLSAWISTPPVTAVDSLLYVDARIRLEGFNITLIEYAAGTQPAPWPIVSSNR